MYVVDEDEWVCERCGWPAPRSLARLFRISRPRVRDRQAALEDLEEELLEEELDELELPAEFDADELGLDTEDEED